MNTIKQIAQFYLFVLQRFSQQRCNESAASLSYTSLLSLVPLMAVIFAAFSSFPAFHEVFEQLKSFIFNNFVPSSGEVIQDYLNLFVEKASKLTLVGMISLFIIALLLMRQIDKSLNKIWHVHQSKNYLRLFLMYWAVLTLGPVLIGISLMVTSYLSTFLMLDDAAASLGFKKELLLVLPIVLTMTAFTLLYMIVPNTRVEFLHAVIGGLTATILFELAKKGFAFYISHNQTYANLYGALATIPIFLIWIYISWLVTLLGAMTTRCIILFDFSSSEQKKVTIPLLSAFHLLWLLYKASQTGSSLSEKSLHEDSILCCETHLEALTQQLSDLCWIQQTQEQRWILTRDLDTLTLWDLYVELHHALPQIIMTEHDALSKVFQNGNKLLAKEFNIPIKELFVQYKVQ